MRRLNVGLFNDSFPPVIDGVANTVLNYAECITNNGLGRVVVATPWYPDVRDEYAFPVVRYPSAYISQKLGYRAGFPFDPTILKYLSKANIDIIHSHCPFISTVLARALRYQTGAPIVFTYHTKFDIDIEKVIALNPVRSVSIKFLLSNINACDEVWVVSKGAGENLKSLGYSGEYLIMENGTDFPKGRASQEELQQLSQKYQLSDNEPVFLFVGRMMWYKNVRLSLDALKIAKQQGLKFKMLLVGDGIDRPDMEDYIQKIGLQDSCIFTGAIRDRELLRVYFSRADLFLFPSTYDTNGIVVKEAAACSCPSLLVKNSCASEGIIDGDTGILAEENPESIAQAIMEACRYQGKLKEIGENAAERVYLSWSDAVARAYSRYEIILENYEKKTDPLSKKEIFFDNVQRIRDDIEIKAEQMVSKYKEYGTDLRNRISDMWDDKKKNG